MGNYNAICEMDTDDGSSYIQVYNNVLAYASAGLKSDFGGHHEVYHNNVLPYVDHCFMHGMEITASHELGFNDGFYNNSCIYTNELSTKNDVRSNVVFGGVGPQIKSRYSTVA